jgi:CRISPR-associated protein Csb2
MKRYIAVKYVAEYRGAEYPPSPMKLLQAVIASSQDQYREVLSVLEAQAPAIYAVEPKAIYEYERYVINNDERLQHNNTGTKKKDIVRMFSGENVHVVFEYDVSETLLPEFTTAISQVHTLGRAGDWVFASVQSEMPQAEFDAYAPTGTGNVSLRSPVQGSVDSLFAAYKTKSAVIFKNVAYTKNPSKAQPRVLFELTDPVPAQQATVLVAQIRHALMDAGVKGVDGHDNAAPRLQIVPLVTTDFNDGMIRRVALVSPDASFVKTAESKAAGLELIDDEGKSKGYLVPTEFDAVASQYLGSSKRWVAVTPILQSGFHNNKPGKRSRLYAKMFKDAGLPQPVRVQEVLGRTDDYKVSAKHGHDKLPRVRLLVEFAEEVPGPVAIGTGRYAGLGVFAAE